ncbi:tetratricopeptide repeat protein [Pelagibacterium halotolerans]|uniref:tetratricopeptide repeat protein n=1 Tax=Pelagibacterium halotolerans TaxID=531813 RepID=UPI00384DB114
MTANANFEPVQLRQGKPNTAARGPVVRFNPDTKADYSVLKAWHAQHAASKIVRAAKWRIFIAELARRMNKNKIDRWAAGIELADRKKTVEYLGKLGDARRRVSLMPGMRRCVMPIIRSVAIAVAAFSGTWIASVGTPVYAQSAADAAHELAMMLDSATMDLSGDNLVSALENAAAAGQPIALWQLGLMYESGVGVEKDQARAFQYFSQIANENADAPPRSLDADIVAQSFVKMGEYYLNGVPDAGIAADQRHAQNLILHAASYFGDADAQYRAGLLYLDPDQLGVNPLQGARWLSLAARKGHPGAQARLGDLLFRGDGIERQPVEGLMWLILAQHNAAGTGDEGWISDMTEAAKANVSEQNLTAAQGAADMLGSQFAGY